jgi:plastocyanin
MKAKYMTTLSLRNSINRSPSWRRGFILIPLLLACFAFSPAAQAAPKPSPTPQTWFATVGAQSTDQGQQALAFLPNEIWIHAGDSITWTFDVANEIHTVTFLTEGQVRPPDLDGCSSSNPATFDGSTCVTSDPFDSQGNLRGAGYSFTVKFTAVGNFKVVCLVHENMTGAIHVLDSKLPLPHDQAFYDAQTTKERDAVLSDSDSTTDSDDHALIAGIGEVSATAGGSDTRSLMRFYNPLTAGTDGKIQIHVGDTVQWTNQDPITPHTITFGTEPADPGPPSANVTVDPDGVLHATVKLHSDNVHSGVIIAAPQERTGLPQSPLGFTRFRVTFPNPGVFPYVCAFHDVLGMTGEVDVSP